MAGVAGAAGVAVAAPDDAAPAVATLGMLGSDSPLSSKLRQAP
jgi:hypothetical protein